VSQTIAVTRLAARKRWRAGNPRPSRLGPRDRSPQPRRPPVADSAAGQKPQDRCWCQVTTWTSWHRWTAISLLAYAFLAVAAALQRACDAKPGELGLIPVTIPELLRHLRGTVIPEPRRDKAHRDAWSLWRRRHQYQAQQAHQRWHAYADEPPR
jgi:hypothetical protein